MFSNMTVIIPYIGAGCVQLSVTLDRFTKTCTPRSDAKNKKQAKKGVRGNWPLHLPTTITSPKCFSNACCLQRRGIYNWLLHRRMGSYAAPYLVDYTREEEENIPLHQTARLNDSVRKVSINKIYILKIEE